MVDHLADQSFRGWHPRLKAKSSVQSKRFQFIALLMAALALGAFLGARPAKKYYSEWREKRHFERATSYLAKGDYKHALLDARNALAFNWANTEAIRIVAKSHEALQSPQVLEWRAKLGQLLPDDLENALAWAAAAIRNNDFAAADRILRRIPYADHGLAQFHHLSAMVALNKRDAVKAEFHWSEAAKLNPDEDDYKLNMASVRLKLGSALERTNAIDLLNQLRLKPTDRIPAMRALLSDALSHREYNRAKEIAIALADDPAAPFSDKLLRLSALRTMRDPDFASYRTRLEAEVTDNADFAYELIIWMNRNGYANEVPALTPKLRAEFVTRPPVSIAIADAYAVSKDWSELQKVLKGTKWYQLDYIRLATLAWAMDQSGDRGSSANVWKTAVTAAEGRLERMETLAKAAIKWGWDARAEDALWSITTFSVQSPTWVLQTLWTKFLKRGDTDKLRQIARLMLQANPRSVAARNNYIFLSLLKRTEEGSPHLAAESLYKENPVTPSVVSTYSLSLFLLGRASSATAIMETLTPTQLREPALAIYYGIFLTASKRVQKAQEYLQIGESWPLLPEEETILDRVLQKNTAVPAPKSQPPTQPASTPP